MLFLSIYVLVVSTIASYLVFAPKVNETGDSVVDMRSASWGMQIAYRVVIVLCLMLLGIVLGDRAYDPTPSAFVAVAQTLAVFAVLLGLMCFMIFTGIQEEEKTPLLNVLTATSTDDGHLPLLGGARITPRSSGHAEAASGEESNQSNEQDDMQDDTQESTDATTTLEHTSALLEVADERQQPTGGEESGDNTGALVKTVESVTLGNALASLEFHLHFVALMLGCGCGLVLINNLGQLTSVVGISDGDQKVLVSLQSVFNCFGRLLGGWLSDFVLARYGFTRPSSLAVTMMCMCIAMLTLSFASPASLFIGTILVGLSYGSIFALSPVMAGEHFGVRYLGSIYTSLAPGISVGSFGLASFLFAGVYDANTPEDQDTCHGAACVRVTFVICAVFCFVASLLCVWLARRTRPRFVKLYPQYEALKR
jgi:Na+/melibiose symporter-like transporter